MLTRKLKSTRRVAVFGLVVDKVGKGCNAGVVPSGHGGAAICQPGTDCRGCAVVADLDRAGRFAQDDEVAVVGIACRLPKAPSPAIFWRLLEQGLDSIAEPPIDRWGADTPHFGKGGFLDEIDRFDPGFFGISPAEAVAMDPQQRLMLELSWEALEDAGVVPATLRGSQTGVFTGASSGDYEKLLFRNGSADVTAHTATGTNRGIISNRVSYALGLHGPSLTVDSAQSSSLVAVHMAAESLRRGEVTLAIAGGVNLAVTPEYSVALEKLGALSPDGRCFTFDARANGIVLGEGGGAVVLKPLSRALADGDRIYCVIRGSAVNNDGAGDDLTVPNPAAQAENLRMAYRRAGVTPSDVQYVELHGTGTRAGDPVEAAALGEVAGLGRAADAPLVVGSVKTNIGHLAAAAGIAGLLKTVLAIKNRRIPASLNYETPNPLIPLHEMNLRVQRELGEWPRADRPLLAGVSAFGMGGTNCHVVLAEPPRPPDTSAVDAPVEAGPVPWLISGRSEVALRAQAAALAEHVRERPELAAADVARSLATARSVFEHRAVVIGGGAELLAGLDAVATGGAHADVVRGAVRDEAAGRGRIAMVFSGAGGQWRGMGASLWDSSPVFAESVAECAEAFEPYLDWSLVDVVRGRRGAASLARVDVVQPALFTMMVSLASVWRSLGVVPSAVVGHSQGEIAAAYVAGGLSLVDAARLVASRSQIITARLSGRGAMLSVSRPVTEVEEWLAEADGRLAVAGVNGPRAVTVAGDPEAIGQLAERLAGAGVPAARIQSDFASHSPQIESVRDELLTAVEGLRPQSSQTLFCSTVTGGVLETGELDAEYWYRNLRQTVRFDQAVRTLLDQGFDVFVEPSPHPMLAVPVEEVADDHGKPVAAVHTLRMGEGDNQRLLSSVAAAHVNGVRIDWTAVLPEARRIELPTYAFQRGRYWPAPAAPKAGPGRQPFEVEFWDAVDRGELASVLGVDASVPLSEALPSLSSWRHRNQELSALDSWRYRVGWREVTARPVAGPTGMWLVLVPQGQAGDPRVAGCVRALIERGARPHVVEVTEADANREALAVLLEQVPEPVAGVLSLWALDERAHHDHPALGVGLAGTIALLRAEAVLDAPARIWVATGGAVSVAESDPVTSPAQAMLWGLGRVAALEHPARWGGLIDLPETLDDRTRTRLGDALGGIEGEDELALRPSALFGRRLEPAPLREDRQSAWTPRGTVLVTGATGELGPQVARWLAGHGAEHLVLTSRRGEAADGMPALRAELTELGTRVTVVACDVTDRAALEALLSGLAAGGDTLRAVVHAAAVVRQASLAETGLAEFAEVVSAKARGAANLDTLLRDHDLDAFVLFSSIAGVWGSAEHGAYAAANSYLDALARHRRDRGRTAISVAWGMWDSPSPREETREAAADLVRRRGLRFMDPDTAFAGLAQAIGHRDTTVAITDVDWTRFVPAFVSTRPSTLFSRIPQAVRVLDHIAQDTPEPAPTGTEFVGRLSAMSPVEQDHALLELVRSRSAAILGHRTDRAIKPNLTFREIGFDSLNAVELRNQLVATTGLRLPTTLQFDHPTPSAVAAFLRAELFGTDTRPTAPAPVGAALDEPIAIVGMACRFPGTAVSPEAFWDLLKDGRDAVSGFPADRGWKVAESDNGYARVGGFLYDAAEFDPGFFGISPREALAMDPQQRLLLESAWEVFENAGIDPQTLRTSATGVFVGSGGSGYGNHDQFEDEVDGYLLTGHAPSVLSGRLSYVFGFEGPAVTVDTACSSSLVALHLAVQSLRSGECSLALAGGVTVMSTPEVFTEFSRQGGLSADGRCKPFAEAADGTGWSEGAGLVLLERLSDARRNGHEVLAVVRGSAVNQDGASNGLTAPNGPSQQRVIRQALANAGVSADQVDVVEAHGTGTTLGDPIEAQALLATYGQDRPADRPLWLGSVKSNIGHTQAAAGVAGVIKMVQSLRHGVLPRSLHVDAPSSHVDWSAGAVELLTEERPWPQVSRPLRAGVSSFGISGTNAHVILEQAPEPEETPALDLPSVEPDVVPWVLSAKSEAAVREQARLLAARVRGDEQVSPVDVAYSLATGRAGLEHRAVVVAGDRDGFLGGLDAVAAGELPPGVVRGSAQDSGGVVFVFPGQGSQWVGMATGLLESSPVFAERLAVCGAALSSFVDWSLLDVLRGVVGAPSLDRVDVVQPVLWAVMVSLAQVWRAHGVVPAAVVGHSQGEIAAACVAGGLSLEDGARVVALRSQALTVLAGRGGMVSVAESVERVRERIEPFAGRVSVAAVNGPASVVVSGESGALDELIASCEAGGVRARRIPVDYASHSVQVEQIHEELLEVLAPVSPVPAAVPMYSTVTGALVDTASLDAEYWFRNLRQTVEFEQATRTLLADGYQVFVEASSHPVVVPGLQETIEDTDIPAAAVGTLRRDDGGLDRFLLSLGEAHAHGATVDWERFFAGTGARRVELPTYAFQRQRFWLEAGVAAGGVESVDGEFWRAVEQTDVDAVAAALAVDGAEVRSSLDVVLPVLSSWRERRQQKSVVDAWRYRVRWKRLPDPVPVTPSGTWLVVVPDHPNDEWMSDLVAGMAGRRVAVSATDDPETVTRRLREALADGPVAGVLSLLAPDEQPLAEFGALPGGLAATVSLFRAWIEVDEDAPMWVATRGAMPVEDSANAAGPSQALVWGLGRVAALEHPDRWGGLVDLPEELDEHALTRLTAVLAGAEDQVAVRASGVFGRRLVRAEPARNGDWSAPATVLVTGGTGALGARVARWLAGNGTEHLVLTSRRGREAPGAADLEAELTALGVRVSIVSCDVADREAVAELLTRFPVTGIVHAAGVLDDGAVGSLTPARMDAVLRAKVVSAVNLHELTREHDLDMFVLFSSTSAVIGTPGLGNYAPGNAFLDALAERRRAGGLAATSIAWGPWADGGMAAGAVGEVFRRHGVPEMAPELALAALRQALADDETALVVADIEWERFFVAFTATRPSPLLADLPEGRQLTRSTAGTVETTVDEGSLAHRLGGLAEAEQSRVLLDIVRAHAAVVLGHGGPEEVEPRRSLKDLGFDSVTAVEFRNRLAAATGLRLPVTLAFDYPTPVATAQYLRAELLGAPSPVDAPAAAGTATEEPLAIIGMACRFPGGVRSPEDLWQIISDGADTISAFPGDRGWDLSALHEQERNGAGGTREGGFLYNAADFDAHFFGISPREALAMDPQQRLLLETAWEVFERAGIDPETRRDVGVFAGSSGQDYINLLAASAAEFAGHAGIGNASSVLSGRLSYVFGFEGPAVTVDTACSSSLVALHLAVQSLRSGECSLALAGGVMVMSTPQIFAEFSQQGGVAADGRCKPFAESADGAGFSEGIGLLLVERLSDAQRNGHQVLAVVRGSAVNQDGASNGLTAPNGPSQQRVIRQALANAGVSADEIDAVEAHGTGTALGDPIEAQALLATYGQDRPADRPLWLGSIKSNIGHTQAAAGVAGVIKMVQAMRHRVLPKSLHIDAPSSHVDWSTGAVELLNEERPWLAAAHPRRAGVSSFGISGTNAHVILEQAPEETPAPNSPSAEPDALPWVLSAKNAEALRDQARALRARVRGDEQVSLVDVAYSLATTRTALEHRAAVVAGDRDGFLRGLDAVAAGELPPGVVQGTAQGSGDVVFVFPGQGAQWVGMAVGLLESSPVFAERLAECAAALSSFVDWSLLDVLNGVAGAPSLERVDVVQPVLWAVMVSLAQLWRSHGVVPAAVVGHSQGEIAAACVAGGLSLEDGARISALRSRALLALAGHGEMLSIVASAEWVREQIEPFGEQISVAAVNGPKSVVVSGDPDALRELGRVLRKAGVMRWTVPGVDFSAHSVHVEQIRDEVFEALAPITPMSGAVPFYSTLAGEVIDTATLDADYWYRNVRHTVEFEQVTRTLLADGYRVFVEVSSHPVLTLGLQETFEDTGTAAAAAGTLRRDEGGFDRFLLSLAEAHAHGASVDWNAFFAGTGAHRVDLPTYPFQRRRYWPETDGGTEPVARTFEDDRFWQAVQRQEHEALGAVLGVDDEESLKAVLPALLSWRNRGQELSIVDSWRYRVVWRPVAEPTAGALSDAWLVLVPAGLEDSEPVTKTIAALSEHGAKTTPMVIDAAAVDRGVLAERLSGVLDADPAAGVLSLLAFAEGQHPLHRVEAGLAATVVAAQALTDAGVKARLWCLTRGAVSTGTGDPLADPVQAQVLGLGRVVALEHPDTWGGLIDLPAVLEPRALDRLVGLLDGALDEDELAVRSSGVFARRLVRAPYQELDVTARWQPRGTVLITGGTGALGSHVARWLARDGAEHLVLTSRSGKDAPGANELRAELEACGATVTIAACDVADRAALAALLDGLGDVRAVVHAAGLVDVTPLLETGLADFAEIMAAKVGGAINLDELLGERELDAFVLFSSNAGVWGSGGQSAYAAANTFLDALAQQRRDRGQVATSVAWGAWGESGMAAESSTVDYLSKRGVLPMRPELAIAALRQAVAQDETFLAVAEVDWERFVPTFTVARQRPLLKELGEVRRILAAAEATQDEVPGDGGALARRLAGLSPEAQEELLLDLVRSTVATVLRHGEEDSVAAGLAFKDQGFDSLTSIDLRNRLNSATGLTLPVTVVFDHPTPIALIRHLRAELVGHGEPAIEQELDRLENAITAMDRHGDRRGAVRTRLEALLRKLDDDDQETGPVSAAELLESASDEEVFDFIDNELA
ncbi:type I polyketide synthase [Amycolatopsis lurida]